MKQQNSNMGPATEGVAMIVEPLQQLFQSYDTLPTLIRQRLARSSLKVSPSACWRVLRDAAQAGYSTDRAIQVVLALIADSENRTFGPKQRSNIE